MMSELRSSAFADEVFTELTKRLPGKIDDEQPEIVIVELRRFPAAPPLRLDFDIHFRVAESAQVWRWLVSDWDAEGLEEAAAFQALLIRTDLREAADTATSVRLDDPRPPRDLR